MGQVSRFIALYWIIDRSRELTIWIRTSSQVAHDGVIGVGMLRHDGEVEGVVVKNDAVLERTSVFHRKECA